MYSIFIDQINVTDLASFDSVSQETFSACDLDILDVNQDYLGRELTIFEHGQLIFKGKITDTTLDYTNEVQSVKCTNNLNYLTPIRKTYNISDNSFFVGSEGVEIGEKITITAETDKVGKSYQVIPATSSLGDVFKYLKCNVDLEIFSGLWEFAIYTENGNYERLEFSGTEVYPPADYIVKGNTLKLGASPTVAAAGDLARVSYEYYSNEQVDLQVVHNVPMKLSNDTVTPNPLFKTAAVTVVGQPNSSTGSGGVLVNGVDYNINYTLGRVQILPACPLPNGTMLHMAYQDTPDKYEEFEEEINVIIGAAVNIGSQENIVSGSIVLEFVWREGVDYTTSFAYSPPTTNDRFITYVSGADRLSTYCLAQDVTFRYRRGRNAPSFSSHQPAGKFVETPLNVSIQDSPLRLDNYTKTEHDQYEVIYDFGLVEGVDYTIDYVSNPNTITFLAGSIANTAKVRIKGEKIVYVDKNYNWQFNVGYWHDIGDGYIKNEVISPATTSPETDPPPPTYVDGVDYTLDRVNGEITFLSTGAIANGSNVTIAANKRNFATEEVYLNTVEMNLENSPIPDTVQVSPAYGKQTDTITANPNTTVSLTYNSISNVIVKHSGNTKKQLFDYDVDLDAGVIRFPAFTSIPAAANVDVSYTYKGRSINLDLEFDYDTEDFEAENLQIQLNFLGGSGKIKATFNELALSTQNAPYTKAEIVRDIVSEIGEQVFYVNDSLFSDTPHSVYLGETAMSIITDLTKGIFYVGTDGLVANINTISNWYATIINTSSLLTTFNKVLAIIEYQNGTLSQTSDVDNVASQSLYGVLKSIVNLKGVTQTEALAQLNDIISELSKIQTDSTIQVDSNLIEHQSGVFLPAHYVKPFDLITDKRTDEELIVQKVVYKADGEASLTPYSFSPLELSKILASKG